MPCCRSVNPLAIFGGFSVAGGTADAPLTLTGAQVVSIGYGVAKAVPDRVADAWCASHQMLASNEMHDWLS